MKKSPKLRVSLNHKTSGIMACFLAYYFLGDDQHLEELFKTDEVSGLMAKFIVCLETLCCFKIVVSGILKTMFLFSCHFYIKTS